VINSDGRPHPETLLTLPFSRKSKSVTVTQGGRKQKRVMGKLRSYYQVTLLLFQPNNKFYVFLANDYITSITKRENLI
jgi:hypothetical protein